MITTPETLPPTDNQSRFERHPPGSKEKAFLLYTRHQDLSAIAVKLGIPLLTIRKWSSVGKWKDRRLLLEGSKPFDGFTQKKPSGPDSDGDEAFEQLRTLPLGEQQASYETMMRESALRMALAIQRCADGTLIQQADKIAKMDATARKALCLESPKQQTIINVALLSGPGPSPLADRPCAVADALPAVEVLALAS
jgi:hypothetical protein